MFACLVCGLTSLSTAMAMSRWSVNLARFPSQAKTNQYSVHILSLVTDQLKEEYDRRKYFVINLHESMEPIGK